MREAERREMVLLTAANHTSDLPLDLDGADDPTPRRLRIFEAEFEVDRAEGRPRVWSVNRRRTRRFPAAPVDVLDTGDLTVPLRDLSTRGVGLRAPWTGPPELDAVLAVAGERFAVRARTPKGRAGHPMGLELELADDPLLLVRAILRSWSHRWRLRGDVPPDEVTRLMSESGYLGLRLGNPLDPRWLDPPEPRVGLDAIWMDDADPARAVAHISSARAYRHTWVTHQLATLGDHPDRLEARLACYRLLCAVPTLVDDDRALKIAYVNRAKKWHRVLCEDFVRWMNAPAHAIMTAWDRWEPEPGAFLDPSRDIDPRILPLDEGGIQWLQDHLRLVLPPLTRRALDLDGEDPRRGHLHPIYKTSGIERGRLGWVARERGTVVGAALVEISAPHLSVFNLFNLAQLFFDPGAAPELRAALLDEVIRAYARRGIERPMLVSLPGALSGCENGRYHLAETMGLMAWSASGLRQYENFIEYTFGRHRRRVAPPTEGLQGDTDA